MKGLAMVAVQKRAKKRMVAVNDAGRRIGEDHPRAVLTNREVDLVHELHEDGMSISELARKMEVSKGCIWKIVRGYRRGQVASGWRVRRDADGD